MTTTLEMNLRRSDLKCLETGRGFSLKDASGVELTSLKGRVWLTMEGERRDIDLYPGATYTIERDGLTLLNALEPSMVQVHIPLGRRTLWRGWIERFWNWLVRAAEVRARARMTRSHR